MVPDCRFLHNTPDAELRLVGNPVRTLGSLPMLRKALACFTVVLLSLTSAIPLLAANEGQADLDKATELQLQVQTLKDIEKVIELCESAIKKGLDAENKEFAEELIVSSLWQHASQLSAAIFDAPQPHPLWQQIRRVVRGDLEKLLKSDATFGDAYILRAKLELLPGGEREAALQLLSKADTLFPDNVKKRSELFRYRAQLQSKSEAQIADLSKAIELDAANSEAWQLRAVIYASQGNLEKAIEDFEALLKNDNDNLLVHQAVAEALLNLEKYDLALGHIARAIEIDPKNSGSYVLRSRIHEQQGKEDEALADLKKALEINSTDVLALLARSTYFLRKDELELAREDVERALQLNPGLARGFLLRSLISAQQGRTHDAIKDILVLIENDPANVELKLQLGSYYVADKRPRKAIEVFTEVIKADAGNASALRSRGDALLSVGKHAEAIEDYNKAIKLAPENDGILNNLAWVLSTSPEDKLRDGKRAVELAKKACEVTNFEAPHILSTLAAAYAESGDFKSAIEWSTKAVELGRQKLPEQVDQLQQELDSYKAGKPFREMQNIEEKAAPPRRVIET